MFQEFAESGAPRLGNPIAAIMYQSLYPSSALSSFLSMSGLPVQQTLTSITETLVTIMQAPSCTSATTVLSYSAIDVPSHLIFSKWFDVEDRLEDQRLLEESSDEAFSIGKYVAGNDSNVGTRDLGKLNCWHI